MTIPEIEVDALAAAMEAGTIHLVDVREPNEFTEGHVPGAVLVPLGEVPDRVHDVHSDAPTYLICRSGARSMRACEFLVAQGLDVTNVAGGTMAWVASGRGVDVGAA